MRATCPATRFKFATRLPLFGSSGWHLFCYNLLAATQFGAASREPAELETGLNEASPSPLLLSRHEDSEPKPRLVLGADSGKSLYFGEFKWSSEFRVCVCQVYGKFARIHLCFR